MASHAPASTWQLGPENHPTHFSAPVVSGHPPLLLSSWQDEPCLSTLSAQLLGTPWLLGGEHSRVILSRNNHPTRETEPYHSLTLLQVSSQETLLVLNLSQNRPLPHSHPVSEVCSVVLIPGDRHIRLHSVWLY